MQYSTIQYFGFNMSPLGLYEQLRTYSMKN